MQHQRFRGFKPAQHCLLFMNREPLSFIPHPLVNKGEEMLQN
ncbi:MAG: hypothetical protein QNJ70_05675 [Xenococcaceae cyanobacterium MO_207.B15]|nr:hypothetical protein [Xenococcaceae cyanobacterium MO_207.B15]